MLLELEEDKITAPTYYYRHTSELIYGPSEPSYNDPEHLAERENFPYVGPAQIRKKFYRMLLRQVAKIGIKVDYGQRVDQYFDDEKAGVGGVVIEDGSVRVADIAVAADAFKSRSELLIAGTHAHPVKRYVRLPFRKRWEGVTANEFWLGAGMHIGLYVSPDLVAFGITPRDEFLVDGSAKAKESWDPDVDPEEVETLIRATPRGSLVHWPLLWRNLRPKWTSRGGRVVQVRDCAHSTIPASVRGGTLALEDAITLASSLQLASHGGSSGAPLGAKVYHLL
ncbi:unnamed protein product [Penicillium egyptiacum]|uniref:FAD-binding domain-containing protein n=1 Tax=Penicillium egyptiacum TaxID=1303716 RepID=A0A9W4P5B4_9EURO|nr:unnamed protein product [Penicillium egyptiacum]